ncbi:hypothetical protein J437_LFUL000352 [Ladona fulva]|uniref:Fibronectin type-III domain-containing protein n=1 Tax=Ladona fulva TaxID=123851 RepID=A0A8K0JV17_LADFU|nr:hypothetical protein J437_LFUL000352 [Ladona fulva]
MGKLLPMLLLYVVCRAGFGDGTAATVLPGVRHLMGEPDFRSVTLRWECDRVFPAPHFGFRVNYCEMQVWGHDRCRLQDVNATSSNEVLMAPNSPVRMFFAQINGLRMSTNYSFEVWPIHINESDQDPISNDIKGNLSKRIVLETKGFSAKATLCLPQFSEVEVETGPYFGGRIAVEGADDKTQDNQATQDGSINLTNQEESELLHNERKGKKRKQRKGRCWIDGDPESPQTSYVLRIDHGVGQGESCGGGSSVSTINDTAVSAFVMVQESPSILTHSARRFLVLCSYQPGTLTVRAGIQLPSSGDKGQSFVEGYGYADDKGEGNSINEVRVPRILRQPHEKKYDGLILARARTAEKLSFKVPDISSMISNQISLHLLQLKTVENKKPAASAQLVLMLLLVVSGAVGFAVLAVWRFVIVGTKWRHGLLGEYDGNESICGPESVIDITSHEANSEVGSNSNNEITATNEESSKSDTASTAENKDEVIEKKENTEAEGESETRYEDNDNFILKIPVSPNQSDV